VGKKEREMLYSNRNLESEARQFDWGTIFQVALGEHGRGRRLLTLTCPEDTEIKSGINEEYSIGSTKSGKPRIVKKKDNELYMILSSEGGYTRRGDGTIKVLVKDSKNIEVLARGNGADGLAGRIGTWDCVLIHLEGNLETVVQVRTSGAGYGTPADLYVVKENKVYHCTIETIEDCCEAIDMELPFKVLDDSFDKEEWLTL
jgi:hypothetical protein